jgi:plastocyanin
MRLLAGTVTALLAVAGSSSQLPERGTITGKITLTTAVRGVPLASNVYQPRAVGRHEPGRTPEILNVLVFLKDASFKGTLPASRQVVEQVNEAFFPRVVAVTRGSVVAFPNGDPYFHNVFSLSRGASFDLGRFRRGDKRERLFTRAGIVKVYCHIHSEMAATILVFDHRLYATPATDGSFAIDDVAPGTYQLSAWHERIGETTKAIQVIGGEAASVEFSLPVVER